MTAETILRAGRVTRHLPWLRGLGLACHVYKAILPFPAGWSVSVADFDGDLKLNVDPREFIGINVWHRPELFERSERQVFCRAIKPGTVVLDVGANVGIYTLSAAKRGARVFSIEADPRNACRLREHVELNSFHDQVTVYEMAALDRAREVRIYRNPSNCGGSNVFEGVAADYIHGDTIDSLNLPSVDVCKVDIEGAEPDAIRGMKATIARSPNMKMLIEYNPNIKYGNPRELISVLRELFACIEVVGGERVLERDPSGFCNLWVSQPIAQP